MMKKFITVILALTIILLPSCKNQGKKADKDLSKDQTEVSQAEKLAVEDLKINLANLLESVKKMNTVPFVSGKNGSVVLSDKEKMVKPEYLADPAYINGLATLTQKYRAAAILTIDRIIADLYEMPVAGFDEGLAKLNIDINDPALKEFSDGLKANKNAGEIVSQFCDKEYNAGRANLFWEAVAASLVEQVYVCSQNVDKFMPMFTDESAAEVTYNFVCVQEGIKSLFDFYPEMQSLNSILEPLYVINAISVDQLRSQLLELKGEIEVVRSILMK